MRYPKCGLHQGGCELAIPKSLILFLQSSPQPHLGRGVILQLLIGISKAGVDLFTSVSELKDRGRSLEIQECPMGDTDFFGDLAQDRRERSRPYFGAGRDWVSKTVQCVRCWLQGPYLELLCDWKNE